MAFSAGAAAAHQCIDIALQFQEGGLDRLKAFNEPLVDCDAAPLNIGSETSPRSHIKN